jgi:hypothetical protein
MRTKVEYEWTLEELEDGDIIDNNYSDKLYYSKEDLPGRNLGLVRNEGNENAGLTDRYWAYVKDGKLPDYFTDGCDETVNIKVPAKFHKELASYLKSI